MFFLPYERMEHVISTLRGDKLYYNFWKYNLEAIYQLNCPQITLDLSDYLQSTISWIPYIQGSTWGLRALVDTGKFIVNRCEEVFHLAEIAHLQGVKFSFT